MSPTSAAIHALVQRVLDAVDRRPWGAVAVILLPVYALTAHWWGIANVDGIAAAWPAHVFADRGTFFLEDVPGLPDNPWFSQSGDHVVSNRMPGVILVGVPLQWLFLPLGGDPVTPAVLTAVLLTTAALANLALLLTRAGGGPRAAVAATLAIGLGTGMWPNASAELWTHGPDVFWLSCALLAAQASRPLLVGVAMAPAVMTRPHLAVVAMALGVGLCTSRRTLLPLLSVGLPSAFGASFLLGWNAWLFAEPSVGGGYTYAAPNVTATSASAASATLMSAAGTLASPLRGALLLSPFLLVGIVGALRAMRVAPAWSVAACVGGLAYQLVQWRINAFTGGSGYFSYRLPLEFIVLATPAGYLGYLRMRERGRIALASRALVGASIAMQAVGVFWFRPVLGLAQELDPWRTFGPGHAAASRGTVGVLVALAMTVIVTLGCCWRPAARSARWAGATQRMPTVSAAVPS